MMSETQHTNKTDLNNYVSGINPSSGENNYIYIYILFACNVTNKDKTVH